MSKFKDKIHIAIKNAHYKSKSSNLDKKQKNFRTTRVQNEKVSKVFGAGTFDDDQPFQKNVEEQDKDVREFIAEQQKRRR